MNCGGKMRIIADAKTINKYTINDNELIILEDKYFFVDIANLLKRYLCSAFLCDDKKIYWRLKEFLIREGISPARVIIFSEYKKYKDEEEKIAKYRGINRIEKMYCLFHTIINEQDYNNIVIADCKKIFNLLVKNMSDDIFWE